MRWLLFVFWLLAAPAETRYEIDLAQASKHTLTVSVETECRAADCDFQLPVWNATYQIRDFAQYVTDFETNRPHRTVAPSRWRLKATPGERVRIRYRYLADSPGPFGCSASSRHVFLNFAQILMYPVDRLREPMTVRFLNKPANWKTALELPEHDGAFHARHYDELVDSPVELSAFAERQFSLSGRRLRIAVDGEAGDYDLGRLESTCRKVAEAATGIMQDVPFPAYTFIYHFRKGGGGGMEHVNSTAIDATAPCKECDLAGVTAHEFFHLWNVKRIRPQSLEPIDYTRENITPSLWFSEGVTSTYGTYIQLLAGLEDGPTFLKRLQEEITRYERIPARLAQSAEESSIAAWLERYPLYLRPSRSISYYLKGELAGYLLDLTIRHRSGNRRNLDDVMRRLNTEYAQKGRYFEDTAAIERIASEAAGRDMKDFFDTVIRQPGSIEWDRYLEHAGYRLVSTVTMQPSLGLEVSRRGQVTELDEGGPAQRAGVQVGDHVVAINRKQVRGRLERDLEALSLKPGSHVNLEIERLNRVLNLQVYPEFVRRTAYRIEELPKAGALEKAIRQGWLRDAGRAPASSRSNQ